MICGIINGHGRRDELSSGFRPMAYHLLTGATGLLGRYLLRDLMLAGVPVAAIVRPSRRATIRQRVEAMMAYWEDQLGRALPRPVVLEGDISQPSLGLDARARAWAAEHVSAFIHNAASLTFVSTGPDSEPWRSNVHGTAHALDFCREAGIRTFHHVSTAYVCGLREGHIYEHELDVGQTLGNDYERSKVQAEKMVREADFINSLTVFRPSIIVGDSVTGYTTTFHGFYAPLQVVYTIVKSQEPDETGRLHALARLALTGRERKNLVPVDWVSAVMAHVITRPEHYGRTYHLTPQYPCPIRLFRDVLEEVTNMYAVNFKGASLDEQTLTENERLFMDLMQVYSSYWRDDPVFDTTNTRQAAPHLPCPHLDRTMLRMMARWAVDNNFGGGRAKPVELAFDAHTVLDPLVHHASTARSQADRRIGLDVNGPGGGQWQLLLRKGTVIGADLGLAGGGAAACELDSATLASLSRGELSPADALKSGQVQVRGNGLASAELAAALEQLATTGAALRAS